MNHGYSKDCSREKETTIARLRLGYRYPWGCNIQTEEHMKKCRVYGQSRACNLNLQFTIYGMSTH